MSTTNETKQDFLPILKKKVDDIHTENKRIFQGADKLKDYIASKTKVYDSEQYHSGSDCQIKSNPVFITARFRSGSTFLWQFFKGISRVKAFYEPLHENLLNHVNVQTPVQDSHVGVKSYWDEYSALNNGLHTMHKSDFGYWRLLLEENDDYPELNTYIRYLLNSSKGHCPVLQFNRIDFRLPWLRANFPEAKIIHLYRNPRDQWYSMIKDIPMENVLSPDLNTNYDLFLWAAALSNYFPFLTDSIESSYERHYYIWKLSELMGKRCSDVSIDYDEEIQQMPHKAIDKIKSVTGLKDFDKDFISNIEPVKKGLWKNVKPAEWFEKVEYECNTTLKKMGLIDHFGNMALSEIVSLYKEQWEKKQPESEAALLKGIISLYVETRGEKAVFASKVNEDLNELVKASNEVGEGSQKIVKLYQAEINKLK